MPELPEVETTKSAIETYLLLHTIETITVRQFQLRLSVPPDLNERCRGQTIHAITRRGKYLILSLDKGCLLIHLGMSGHLRILLNYSLPSKHDHIDLQLDTGITLRYNDPRRFGLWLYFDIPFESHPLIAHLGPEPLLPEFSASYLYNRSRSKKQSIKNFIMDNRTVVGVGNIYATESLFYARLHPNKSAQTLTLDECEIWVDKIKWVLKKAIEAGGTTLRDFSSGTGKPGYFSHELQVYGRADETCFACGTLIENIKIGGRSSAFCPYCQSGFDNATNYLKINDTLV